jgi:hypothetical protein
LTDLRETEVGLEARDLGSDHDELTNRPVSGSEWLILAAFLLAPTFLYGIVMGFSVHWNGMIRFARVDVAVLGLVLI